MAENRPATPGAVLEDLDRILGLLCVQPAMGTRARRAKLSGSGESRFLESGTTCTTESRTMRFKFLRFGTRVAAEGRASERHAAEHGLQPTAAGATTRPPRLKPAVGPTDDELPNCFLDRTPRPHGTGAAVPSRHRMRSRCSWVECGTNRGYLDHVSEGFAFAGGPSVSSRRCLGRERRSLRLNGTHQRHDRWLGPGKE